MTCDRARNRNYDFFLPSSAETLASSQIMCTYQQLGIEVVDVVEAVLAVKGGTVVLLQVLADGFAVELDQPKQKLSFGLHI